MTENELFGNSEQLNDTISRQAALDALNRIEISRNASWYEFYQKALTVVGTLPPAQPDIIACGDCKHWRGRKYNVHINGFLPWCGFSALQREANDYCSYGERKDGEHETD